MPVFLLALDSEEDRSRFEKIFKENHRLMYHVALGILHNGTDAEDAVQDAFTSLAKRFSKYSHIPGSEMRGLCVTIVKGKAIDILRKQKHLSDEEIENLVLCDDGDIRQPEQAALNREEQDAVRRALHGLPEVLRQTLVLKYYYELDNGEIARLLAVKKKTVEVRLYRGKKMLRGLMENETEA